MFFGEFGEWIDFNRTILAVGNEDRGAVAGAISRPAGKPFVLAAIKFACIDELRSGILPLERADDRSR
jgi:hypothetical protein